MTTYKGASLGKETIVFFFFFFKAREEEQLPNNKISSLSNDGVEGLIGDGAVSHSFLFHLPS